MNQVKVLTLELAERFLKEGFSIREFTQIEDGAAEALANHDGYLDLDGLTSLSDSPGHIALAEKLAKQEGGLSLDGLTSLSDKAAESIAIHHDLDGKLSLAGLTCLSNEAFNTLAGLKRRLTLKYNFTRGLTSLSNKAAEALANHESDLHLSGLTSLTDYAAEVLANHKGHLYLNGLTSISDKAAEAMPSILVVCTSMA